MLLFTSVFYLLKASTEWCPVRYWINFLLYSRQEMFCRKMLLILWSLIPATLHISWVKSACLFLPKGTEENQNAHFCPGQAFVDGISTITRNLLEVCILCIFFCALLIANWAISSSVVTYNLESEFLFSKLTVLPWLVLSIVPYIKGNIIAQ